MRLTPRPRNLPVLPVLGAACILALAGCSTSPLLAEPRARVVAPAPGACWDMTGDQLAQPTYGGTEIECDQPHTVETVATILMPDDLAVFGASAPASLVWVRQRCQPEVNRYVGLRDAEVAAPRTRTWMGFFTAGPSAWSRGEHWVSCAAVTVQPDITSGRQVTSASGSVRGRPADAGAPLTRTNDTGIRGYWATRTVLATAPTEAYPGEAEVQRRSTDFCRRTVAGVVAFTLPPTADDWAAGATGVSCYVATPPL